MGLKTIYNAMNKPEQRKFRIIVRRQFGTVEKELSRAQFYNMLNNPGSLAGDRLKFLSDYLNTSVDSLLDVAVEK